MPNKLSVKYTVHIRNQLMWRVEISLKVLDVESGNIFLTKINKRKGKPKKPQNLDTLKVVADGSK